MQSPVKKQLAYASREEVDIALNVIEGKLPDDLYGHVFFNSPCGTVNSNGLPFEQKLRNGEENPEYGASVFNGDAMLMRFDLDKPGEMRLKTRMLKPPCWYADQATRIGNERYKHSWGFKMLGIARTSFKFGSRNELNTAVNPVIFPGDESVRMTANFDMGRPWEIDVDTMDLKTPIGSSKEWVGEIPSIANYPFPLYQSTAHPCFDPVTKEFFTVNFTKTFETMFYYRKFQKRMLTHHDEIHDKLHAHVNDVHHKASVKGSLMDEDHSEHINAFYKNVDNHIEQEKTLIQKIKSPFLWLFDKVMEIIFWFMDIFLGMKNRIYLLRWDGKQVSKWLVVDYDTGKPLAINQCMHQNNLSKDYIVLSDSAFKFSADIMITNPFPHNQELDKKLRELTAIAQEPFTPIFIIKRSDLKPGNKKVKAQKAVINLETVHFSIDYENPENLITIHTAHNAASCASEWIRPYDTLSTDNSKARPNTIGLMTCGEMDIGRIGKYVVNGETGEIIDDKSRTIHLQGNENGNGQLGAHTWAIALHTHKDIISATNTVDQIRHIYWQSYGTDPRYLTQFIENLYRDYEHRVIPVKEMIDKNKAWLPYCLSRQNTQTMQLEDHYIFEQNENLRSMQFIPRKNEGASGVDTQMDGYIFCTMVVGPKNMEIDEYSREVWLFDAADLGAGPVCKLSHPDMAYAFTIHSAWIDQCKSQDTEYQVNVNEDLQAVINKMRPKNKAFFTDFMKEHVYPHF